MALLPQRARCVIIGGGVIGASTAYHLSKLGWLALYSIYSMQYESLVVGTGDNYS